MTTTGRALRSLSLLFGVFALGCAGSAGPIEQPLPHPQQPTDAGLVDATDAGALPNDEDDAGERDDAGMPPEDAGTDGGVTGRVWAFVAQGHLARTAVSCDQGRTWVADRDDAPANARCWQQPPGGVEIECDHQPTSGRGIGFGKEHVVANFGWGPPGSVRRSRDGLNWETVETGKAYASTVNVEGRLLFASASPSVSDDDGETMMTAPYLGGMGTVRRGGGGDLDGGVFVLSGDNALAVNRSGGLSGWQVKNAPAACRAPLTVGGISVGNGVIVIAGSGGVCVSPDRGDTWTPVSNVGGTVRSTLLWTGSSFVFFGTTSSGTRARFESSDGSSWTSTPTQVRRPLADGGVTTAAGPSIGVVGYGDGTFVAVNDEWGRWYEQQEFFRSDDGVLWEALPKSAFKGSHPITHITFGELDRGGACP